MKVLCQIGIIFGICWVSEIIESLLPIPFPASVISMVLLLVLLLTRVVKLKHIREKAEFLLANMSIFFLPSLVGVIEYSDILLQYLVPLLVICIVSTILTFAATALSIRAVTALMDRRKRRV